MPCDVCNNEDCVGIEPSKLCLTVPRDTDSALTFVLTDEDFIPIDITTDKVKFTVKDAFDGTVKIQLENLAGSHSDPTNGATQFEIPHATIAAVALPADESIVWKYEVRRIQSDNKEALHIQGDFVVEATVGG